MRPSRRFVLVYVCLALCAGVSHASAQAVSQKVSSVRPLWQLEIRRNEPPKDFLGPRVVSDQKRVFYLQGGQVKAVDAVTGQQLWTYQIGKWAQLRYSSGWLLAITQGGKVVALEAQTGRVHWHKEGIYAGFEGLYTGLTIAGKTFYLAEPGGDIQAFNLNTGRLLWRTEEPFLQPNGSPYNKKSLTFIRDRIFVQSVSSGAITTTDTYIYDAKTGKFLSVASSYGPLATIGNKVFFVQDNFVTWLDYPDILGLNVYDLRTGKRLEERTYSIKNRVKGNDWNSKVAVTDAVYISGGGNVACFPLAAPGGKAKPDFIRVPRGDVQWLAGPRNGTFLLEWQNTLWFVKQRQKPCQPVNLLKQGLELGRGTLARANTIENGLYIGLKNGTFYAVNTKTGEVVLKLALRSYTFGPTHVVGNTLVVQAGKRLLAYPLPGPLTP